MKIVIKPLLVLTALAIVLSTSIASAEFTTRLSAGMRFSVSASKCLLSVPRQRTSQVSLKCSKKGSVPRRASNIELKFGQTALIEAQACQLKVTSRSAAIVRVTCNANRTTTPGLGTPTPTSTVLPFTFTGMYDGRCYLKGQDTGEVVNGTGYSSADGITYINSAPANGTVSGVLYQQGFPYSGIYQGGLFSNGIKLTSSGSLDKETFQGTGFISSNAGISADTTYSDPSAVLIQSDSKIVVAGHAWNSDEPVKAVIIRYLSDGTPDPSFGTGGAIVFPFGGYITSAFQFGEKLLLGTEDHILRLNSDGSFDATFGQGGQLSLYGVGSYPSYVQSIAMQTDGRIVVVRRPYVPPSQEEPIVVGRFNTDGSMDTSFGTAGLVTINDSPDIYGVRMVIQPDGGVIISRSGYITGQGFDSGLYRLNSDGSIDTSFGNQGKAVLPNTAGIRQISAQSDGGILVATGSFGRTIYRVKPSGVLDTDFGVGGVAVVPGLPGERSSTVGIGILQTDGKIILAGSSTALTAKGESVGLLVRLTASGALDTSFGNNGVKGYDFANSNYNGIMGVAVQSDGRLVGAASSIDVDGKMKIFTFRLWS
jgi:uncharacterized delta-60 repeat protein